MYVFIFQKKKEMKERKKERKKDNRTVVPNEQQICFACQTKRNPGQNRVKKLYRKKRERVRRKSILWGDFSR